ncbi:MAG: hypothetical protein H8D23_11895 [Candidatus Brocadiales bacterium]|nr:hypothetical protein [Candidatus Brocadiales bacterium]
MTLQKKKKTSEKLSKKKYPDMECVIDGQGSWDPYKATPSRLLYCKGKLRRSSDIESDSLKTTEKERVNHLTKKK